MEAEMLKLNLEKREAIVKAEKLQAEKKGNLEKKIIAGLYSSPLLQAARQAEAELEAEQESDERDDNNLETKAEAGMYYVCRFNMFVNHINSQT